MTVKDYLRLPKRRLAEMLVEYDKKWSMPPSERLLPIIFQERTPLCYEQGGTCTNPFHDCINCPKLGSTGGTWAPNTYVL